MGDKKTVNIRVDGEVWDEVDGNRSKICRQALRNEAEIARQAGDIMNYANDYEEAKQKLNELEAEIEIKRKLLFDELDDWGYDQYILPGQMDDSMGMLEESITFASQYAETYLDADMSKEKVVKRIRADLNEEGRRIPVGVAEWIVEKVDEAT